MTYSINQIIAFTLGFNLINPIFCAASNGNPVSNSQFPQDNYNPYQMNYYADSNENTNGFEANASPMGFLPIDLPNPNNIFGSSPTTTTPAIDSKSTSTSVTTNGNKQTTTTTTTNNSQTTPTTTTSSSGSNSTGTSSPSSQPGSILSSIFAFMKKGATQAFSKLNQNRGPILQKIMNGARNVGGNIFNRIKDNRQQIMNFTQTKILIPGYNKIKQLINNKLH